MKDRKKDLEDLLAHSIELQRRQQLLPQEKVLGRMNGLLLRMDAPVSLYEFTSCAFVSAG